jgi:hypothetical protein
MNKKSPLAITILLLLFILALQSCSSARIVSNKDVNYNRKLKKIYVFISSAKDVDHFDDRLLISLTDKIKLKGVFCEGFVRNPLSLETEEEINKKIDKYNPEALLLIKQTQVTYINGGPGGGIFEITLIDGETKKNVWKSSLNLSGPWQYDSTIETMVEKLLTQMVQDQII